MERKKRIQQQRKGHTKMTSPLVQLEDVDLMNHYSDDDNGRDNHNPKTPKQQQHKLTTEVEVHIPNTLTICSTHHYVKSTNIFCQR